jgi:hypothetical protein
MECSRGRARMQRLAAPVPRPRLHLIRFHSVLAPNAKLRTKVVPHSPDEPAQKELSPEDGEAALGRPMRLGWTKLLNAMDPWLHSITDRLS